MAVTAPVRRPSIGARRTGYLIAGVLNALLAYAINVWPGWRAVPFLTEDTSRVLGLVNLSLVVGLVANLVYLLDDPPRFKAFGDLVTTVIGLAVLVRIWQVFPFDFSGYAFTWALLVRIALVVGIVGAAIGMLVLLVIVALPRPHSWR
jgi:hypothetical protein